MLSIGWPEMMIVAAAALIIVGPRDLPALLRTVGRVAGQVRRMGNDFRRELNKVAAIDEVKDIKKSITQPLTDSRRDIEAEFNRIGKDGSVEPTGALKPADPEAESVYDEIKAATADIKQMPDPEAARNSMAAAVKRAQAENAARKTAEEVEASAAIEKTPAEKKPAVRRSGGKSVPARKASAKASAAIPAASRKTAAKPEKQATKPAAAGKSARSNTGSGKPKPKPARTSGKTAAKQTADKA